MKGREALIFLLDHALIDKAMPPRRSVTLDLLPSGWVRIDCPLCHTLVLVDTEDQPPGDLTCGYGRAIWSTHPICPGL
ncbi:MAG: hypothetical protein M3256_11695 [Actinomycetota bacterium]|nr:hypothetical protein [Actinomycetota bacterium]